MAKEQYRPSRIITTDNKRTVNNNNNRKVKNENKECNI
jgi:hypothetical protein